MQIEINKNNLTPLCQLLMMLLCIVACLMVSFQTDHIASNNKSVARNSNQQHQMRLSEHFRLIEAVLKQKLKATKSIL